MRPDGARQKRVVGTAIPEELSALRSTRPNAARGAARVASETWEVLACVNSQVHCRPEASCMVGAAEKHESLAETGPTQRPRGLGDYQAVYTQHRRLLWPHRTHTPQTRPFCRMPARAHYPRTHLCAHSFSHSASVRSPVASKPRDARTPMPGSPASCNSPPR